MNKIITLPVFLLIASNVFAMHSRSFNNKPIGFVTQKVSLLSTTKKPIAILAPIAANKPVAEQMPAGVDAPVLKQILTTNKPHVEHVSVIQNPQVFLQPVKSVNFLELMDGAVLDQDDIAKIGQLSQSSLTVRKSSSVIIKGYEMGVSALFYEVNNLIAAIKDNDLEKICKYLSQDDSVFDEKTYEDGCNILMFAIKYSNVDTVMFLLQNHKFYLEETDTNGRTALMYAASSKAMLGVVIELLNKGVSVNKEDYKKRNALTYAISKAANIKTATVLLDNGADYCKVDEEGLSVLDRAVLNKNTEMATILLSLGVDKSQVEHALKLAIEEFNIFDCAELNKNIKIIEVLLLHGVSKFQDKDTLIKNALNIIITEYKKVDKKIKLLDEMICKLKEKTQWSCEVNYIFEEKTQSLNEAIQESKKEIKVLDKEREELDYRKNVYTYMYGVFSAYLGK